MAAIFDLDGLLLNTDPEIWLESMHQVASAYQIPISTELLRHTRGLRIKEVTQFWNQYFGWKDDAKAQKIAEEIVDAVIFNTHQKGKLMPGVLGLLESLKSHAVPMAVATSSPKRLTDDLLHFFQIKPYFQTVQTADFCKYGKPHPEVYLNAAEALGIKSWQCVAFEDSINGLVAAKAAKMLAVVVPEPNQYLFPQFGIADKKINSLLDFSYADYLELVRL
ncbi:MAG TPA: hexitol phosphatase HxpB [Edaphocola sp.]|nr:hexitol phosphatase HxpB [Edaphocola sp.]